MKGNHMKENNLTQLPGENRYRIDQWTVILNPLEMAFKYSLKKKSILYLSNKIINLLNPRTILC